jgi:hypothetical protein
VFYRDSLYVLVALYVSSSYSLGQIPTQGTAYSDPTTEYRAVLDAYFYNVAALPASSIAVGTYPSFEPESEIVIQSGPAGYAVAQVTATKQVWGNANDLTKVHSTTQQYISKALTIKAKKYNVPLFAQQVDDLIRQLRQIDISSSAPRGTLKNSKGQAVLMTDGTGYELILEGGRVRTWVTDTSHSDVISENPRLLEWILSLQAAVKKARQGSQP